MDVKKQNHLISMVLGLGMGILGANALPGCPYKESLDVKVHYQLGNGDVVNCDGYKGRLGERDKVQVQSGCAKWELTPEAYGRVTRLKTWLILEDDNVSERRLRTELLIHSDADNDGQVTVAEIQDLERKLQWPGYKKR